MVKRSSGIIMGILQIIKMLKGLRVGLLCYIVKYVGESNVKITYNKEKDLFWWLNIKDQLKLL